LNGSTTFIGISDYSVGVSKINLDVTEKIYTKFASLIQSGDTHTHVGASTGVFQI
jgi:hypothetical protein